MDLARCQSIVPDLASGSGDSHPSPSNLKHRAGEICQHLLLVVRGEPLVAP
jgi:hypothetical protein